MDIEAFLEWYEIKDESPPNKLLYNVYLIRYPNEEDMFTEKKCAEPNNLENSQYLGTVRIKASNYLEAKTIALDYCYNQNINNVVAYHVTIHTDEALSVDDVRKS